MRQDGFAKLVAIMATLRGQKGCPWDRRQRMEDLKPFLIEETYEVLEAIDKGDDQGLREELGDLLFHIIFLSRIAEENGAFCIADVIAGIATKMRRRHPHVFGQEEASDAQQVEANWRRIKAAEKGDRSLMDGIPRHLPSLMRAYRLTQRAAQVGFDWEGPEAVCGKLAEELSELQEAMQQRRSEQIKEELGDVLFTIVNLARLLGIDPEDALRLSTDKFAERFRRIEMRLRAEGKTPAEATIAEMDALWDEGKADEDAKG